ncbi:hypothetical protein AX774_g1761 [Zancudomyces culisetae]|uniref:Uncharacterized protein n=1 Tax=Zancudomyces culisetae TaxID=1213189 RepID=A0A1R1PUS0_ZANCU|nr:hypothetical protein AX774_g1761 [Zancudomyces culisetae]|eukprot:OMH84714.1 hypothetical protein AX774_g1761 [Zancudomyces culisetae]
MSSRILVLLLNKEKISEFGSLLVYYLNKKVVWSLDGGDNSHGNKRDGEKDGGCIGDNSGNGDDGGDASCSENMCAENGDTEYPITIYGHQHLISTRGPYLIKLDEKRELGLYSDFKICTFCILGKCKKCDSALEAKKISVNNAGSRKEKPLKRQNGAGGDGKDFYKVNLISHSTSCIHADSHFPFNQGNRKVGFAEKHYKEMIENINMLLDREKNSHHMFDMCVEEFVHVSGSPKVDVKIRIIVNSALSAYFLKLVERHNLHLEVLELGQRNNITIDSYCSGNDKADALPNTKMSEVTTFHIPSLYFGVTLNGKKFDNFHVQDNCLNNTITLFSLSSNTFYKIAFEFLGISSRRFDVYVP